VGSNPTPSATRSRNFSQFPRLSRHENFAAGKELKEAEALKEVKEMNLPNYDALNAAYKIISSPIGDLQLIAGDQGLLAIHWHNHNLKSKSLQSPTLVANENHPILLETERQLQQYFQGNRKSFSLQLQLIGTNFQLDVWHALLAIPFGETRSYGQLARQLGNPNSMRAVGAANGRNPIPIIVPCHRVIGASGDLVGFGGGLKMKAQLLELERERTASLPTKPSQLPLAMAAGSGSFRRDI
jgi:methylated-DNA-[protein]-cysteine S-methyltransferase